jgi:TonB family protein
MEDASPLPGVNVIIKGSTVGTITDARGGFQIDTDFTEPTLVFSFIGLESQEVNVKNRQDTISVQLQQDVSQLSEVVVTGYGVSTRDNSESSVNYPTLQLANPEVGKESFQDYLKLNVNYPKDAIDNKVEGRVTVQFLVTREGQLNDFTIIRGIGFGCDEELIRLIEAGPKWIPTSRNGIALDEKVKVRFKFELPR